MKNAAGNLMKNKRLLADLHGVSGICSSLVSNHPVGALG
jgi:hypothetical protein